MNGPRVLALDIETYPGTCYWWDLYDSGPISLERVLSFTGVLCFAAKWVGEKKVHFHSLWDDGREGMLAAAFALLDEADILVTYNGKKFDVPRLQREFWEVWPSDVPAPYFHIDLYQVVRSQFGFDSKKLQHVSERIGLAGKVKHAGFPLWKGCMDGDEKARRKMRQYNRQDAVLNEQVYELIKPWIKNHPNVSMYDDRDGCPRCGGSRYHRRGTHRTKVSEYVRFQCKDCGHYFRSTRREGHVTHTDIAAS